MVELQRVLLRQPELALHSLLDVLGHFEGLRVEVSLLVFIVLLSSLKVGLVGVVEALAHLLLRTDLGLDLQFEARALVPIHRLPCIVRPEEVLNLLPLLLLYIELVLNRVGIHDVCQNHELLFVVKVLERIGEDLSVAVDHDNVDVLVPFIGFVLRRVSEQD